jgi:uncharacterized phage protein (TIGR02216 family)
MAVPRKGGIDWAGLIRAGLTPAPAGLGLRPAEFWALTPVELRLMLGRDGGAPPMTRARLAELAAAFPDKRRETDGGD